MQDKPLVGIVMGSVFDRQLMEECSKALKKLDIALEMTVSSAHRTQEKTRDYALSAAYRVIEVIIAGAGQAVAPNSFSKAARKSFMIP